MGATTRTLGSWLHLTGAVMDCPICKQPMIGVEYGYTIPEHFDGVSEWMCNNHPIPYRIGRFTGRVLLGCAARITTVGNNRQVMQARLLELAQWINT